VVTNVVIKPHVDRLLNEDLAGALAAANGDPILSNIHFSLNEDANWHCAWTAALFHVAISDTPANATSFRRGSMSGGHSPYRRWKHWPASPPEHPFPSTRRW
jgi:hypothetical protein